MYCFLLIRYAGEDHCAISFIKFIFSKDLNEIDWLARRKLDFIEYLDFLRLSHC